MAALGLEGHRPCAHLGRMGGSQPEEGRDSNMHLGGRDHGDRRQGASDLRSNLSGPEVDRRVSEDLLDGTVEVGGGRLIGEEVDGQAADSRLEVRGMVHNEDLARNHAPGSLQRVVAGHTRRIGGRE